MPQLIAMVIVVVGAMIYMFQTFGGTGDKIEGVAQKASIITEINNIKDGLKIAAKSGHIETSSGSDVDAVKSLEGLAELSYFAEQINEQLDQDPDNLEDTVNVYNAISFGGGEGVSNVVGTTNTSDMKLSLVADKVNMTPGIYVNLADGGLSDNAAFLEAQIANDLSAVASIDRLAVSVASGALPTSGTDAEKRIPGATTTTPGTNADGKFIIYFKDFGSSEVVK